MKEKKEYDRAITHQDYLPKHRKRVEGRSIHVLQYIYQEFGGLHKEVIEINDFFRVIEHKYVVINPNRSAKAIPLWGGGCLYF